MTSNQPRPDRPIAIFWTVAMIALAWFWISVAIVVAKALS